LISFLFLGSTYGRQAKPKEKQQQTPVLKDIDFLQGTILNDITLPPMYIKLGSKRNKMISQLQADTLFLQQHSIMDYSLLVGKNKKYII
jgi:hypothetical protein